MINFEDAKQKKERGVSVKELLENRLKQTDEFESIVIVGKHKDGTIYTGYSWDNSLEALGMLDIAKIDVTEAMRVDE